VRLLRQLHLYLGCVFAPLLIFFAVSGSWQIFYWHEAERGNPAGYQPPHVLVVLSNIHKEAHIPPTKLKSPTPLRYFMFAAAIGLVATTIIGVIMAYRFSQRPMVATVCLGIGIIVPVVMLWMYH
jgi:hypothetical protein